MYNIVTTTATSFTVHDKNAGCNTILEEVLVMLRH